MYVFKNTPSLEFMADLYHIYMYKYLYGEAIFP